MNIEVGKCYMRRRNGHANVRKIIAFVGDIVKYAVLHRSGKSIKFDGVMFDQRVKNFRKWAMFEVPEQEHYGMFDGATIHPTYLVHGVNGNILFRCSAKRANFYLRKEYVKTIGEKQLQFLNDVTEKKLLEIYGDTLDNEFFLAVKNDRCGVCGVSYDLTRHHIVPQRDLDKVALEIRGTISNVLFVCNCCHKRYEKIVEGECFNPPTDDSLVFVYAWKDHFVSRMNPQYLPNGWDIVMRGQQ